MSRGFKPCLDILPAGQQRLWPQFRPASGLGLVLYGGTAIALRIGHRPSVDFDFSKALVYFKGGDLEVLTEDEKTILVDAVGRVDDLPVVKMKAHGLALPC